MASDKQETDREDSESELSCEGVQPQPCTIKANDLRQFLNVIAIQIDLPAVAVHWCSGKVPVIGTHQAKEFITFKGDEFDKQYKVLEVFDLLVKHEERVPFFLRALWQSGDSSPVNRDLFEELSTKLHFSKDDVETACSNDKHIQVNYYASSHPHIPYMSRETPVREVKITLKMSQKLRLRKFDSSTSSGVFYSNNTSTENMFLTPPSTRRHTIVGSPHRRGSTLPMHLHRSTEQSTQLASLQKENQQLKQKVQQLYTQLMHTQNKLITVLEAHISLPQCTSIEPQHQLGNLSKSLDSIQDEIQLFNESTPNSKLPYLKRMMASNKLK